MGKFITALLLCTLALTQYARCQNATIKIPALTGKINDWEGLFTDAQKSQLDSVSTIFAFKTNIPFSVITFGSANTTAQSVDAFVQDADSVVFENQLNGANMAIFLSKDFRVLNFQTHSPTVLDTSKLGEWKARVQQIFTASVQPYIPLLKEGKYAEALIATISDLAVEVKKAF